MFCNGFYKIYLFYEYFTYKFIDLCTGVPELRVQHSTGSYENKTIYQIYFGLKCFIIKCITPAIT